VINETEIKLKERDTLDGNVSTLENDIENFHGALQLRKQVQGNTDPYVHTRTNVQHNQYPTYALVMRVVKVQLNTFQLETNGQTYNEKYKIVHDLSSKIQKWMRNSTTTTDYEKECNELLHKKYQNSLKFKSWIENASPDFDMHFQNIWVTNERDYNIKITSLHTPYHTTI